MTATTARPVAPAVVADAIPAALKGRDQWICWRYELRGDDWTKVPYRDRDRRARTDDPATWLPFGDALAVYDRHGFDGIGFVFAPDDHLFGLDLDACLSPGEPPGPIAASILGEFDTYAETTPSGRGLHLIGYGVLPGGKGRKSVRHQIEVYDRGRFFTITGLHYPGTPPEPQPSYGDLQNLLDRLFPDTPPTTNGHHPTPAAVPLDDAALIARIRTSKQGGLFDRLWAGDTSGHNHDDSSADLSLCNILAFWCGNDPARIDRLFRASGLYREKWERAGYRDATIAEALAGRSEFYDPGHGTRHARLGGGGGDGNTGDDEAAPADVTDPNGYPHTDRGNAQLFAARLAGDLRFDHRRGAWYRWGGHWWRQDDNGYAARQAGQVSEWRLAAADEIADEDRRKEAKRWARTSQSRSKIEAILKLAQTLEPLAVAGDAWDTEPFRLGVANGVVDLLNGTLLPGDPGDNITLHSPVTYDPDALAPRWEQFLAEVFLGDAELIGYVQRFAGYSLTGDTRESKLLICWGEGANGKSTLLTTLAHVAGDYGYAMPFSTVEAQRNPGGPTNDLAALAGRRLIISSEVQEGQPLNEARIKALTGGDPITARFLNREFFTFQPAAKFWLAVNHKPRVRDESKGFWRRIALLPFLASFEGREDKDLKDKLRDESPGILAWMVRGCLAWQREGLGTPARVTAATEEYARESDPLGDFLVDACTLGDGLAARSSTLYHAYLDWAAEQGIREKHTLDQRRFGQLVGGRFARSRDGQGVVYRGIGLSITWQDRERPTRGRATLGGAGV